MSRWPNRVFVCMKTADWWHIWQVKTLEIDTFCPLAEWKPYSLCKWLLYPLIKWMPYWPDKWIPYPLNEWILYSLAITMPMVGKRRLKKPHFDGLYLGCSQNNFPWLQKTQKPGLAKSQHASSFNVSVALWYSNILERFSSKRILKVLNWDCIANKLPIYLVNYNFFVTFASAIKPKSSYI